MEVITYILQLLIIILAPLAVGLGAGIDRKITARMQNRLGPPVVQPFYDIGKLLAKRPMLLSRLQVVFAGAALLFHAAALALFVAGGDLIVAFFVSGTGSICLVMGAFSARSPYSYIGGQRELLAILAYEPVLFLVVLAIGLETSFLVSGIGGGLLIALPLVLLALIPVLVILLEKSPFDVPTAHQEIMSGPYVEYSGPYLAIMEVARWFQLAFVFGLVTLFFWSADPVVSAGGKLALAFAVLFVTIIIDNITARLTRGRMVRFMLTVGVGLVAINLLVLFVIGQGAI
ncbi:MAG: NADH-quinone oxidoreductase subunit H [Methanomassiliicoccus sp.]|nr:NADH-quinone oxidoreductase subunit H [Methanomassiliicoccus sp.]